MTFEYEVFEVTRSEVHAALKAYGGVGWELVSAVPRQCDAQGPVYVMFLKRQKGKKK